MHHLSPKMAHNPLANTARLTFLLLLSTSYCSTQVLAEFAAAPTDVNVTEGDPLSINCTYTNADRLFWLKDGVEIAPGGTNFEIIDLVAAADTSTLRLTPRADHIVHTGVYDCVAAVGDNEFSTNFTITVQYLADVSINVRPFECVNEGENPYFNSEVIIECSAEGEPFPRVAWFLSDRKLRDFEDPNINFQQNKRILNISSYRSNHTGDYYCRSENDLFPAKKSPQMTLGFQAPENAESVMIENANNMGIIYAAEDRPSMIDCVVSPPFPRINGVVFQLQGNSIQSGGEFVIIVRPCNRFSLKIASTVSTRTGEYRCAYGQFNADVRLKLGSVVPVNVTVSLPTVGVGRDVIFYCNKTRTPESNDILQVFKWRFQREGMDGVIDLQAVEDRVEITNTTIGSVLTLRRVALSDGGRYFCVTFNPVQTSIQADSSVVLNVEDSLPISVTPPTSIVQVGAPLSLDCVMTTTRNSSFFWEVNGVNVDTLGERYSIAILLPNRAVLNISRLELEDIGPIRCIGQDPLHVPVNAEASIVETTEPYIIGEGGVPVTNVNFEIQSNLVLNCTVRNSGQQTPDINWFLGNRRLSNGTEFLIDSSGTLMKNNISVSNEAKYACQAELGAGGRTLELTFNVMVTILPRFTETPEDPSMGTRGEFFVLTCEAYGRPTPTIVWSKMLTRVNELGDPLIRDPGNGSLIFERLQDNHSGVYLCEIEGTGSTTSQTRLMVVDMNADSGVGGLSKSEAILVFTVVGLVAILVLIASVMVIAVLVSCYYMRRPQGKYSVSKTDPLDGAFKRPGSFRDNSGIHISPSNHIFDTLQSPSSTTGYSSNPYSMGPATAIPLATYRGPVPLSMDGGVGGMATNSIFSEAINSHTSTPIHGTMASTSLFGSEEQTSVTTQLPNFPRANLQLGETMGEGEFGPVVMGVATGIIPGEERTLVAVKALLPRGGGAGEEGEEEEELNPEMALVDFANQMKLEFSNIAVILGMCTDEEPYYVIYEYLNEGDLKKFLINSRPFDDDPPSLTPQHMRRIILQVADGMAYLFSQRIIHGDLATRNCLISSDLKVKIADLGIGHDLYNNDYYDNGSQLLPIRWMPPELLVNSDEGPTFSLHSDIWSFGVLCWEVFSYSRLPYDSFTDEDVLAMVPAGTRLRSPSKSCPPALYDIMMDCWHEIPEERPVFAKLCVAIIGCELD